MTEKLINLKNKHIEDQLNYLAMLGYGNDLSVVEKNDGEVYINLTRKIDSNSLYSSIFDENDSKLHIVEINAEKPMNKTTCSLINKKAENFLFSAKMAEFVKNQGDNVEFKSDIIDGLKNTLNNLDSEDYITRSNIVLHFLGNVNSKISKAVLTQLESFAKKIDLEVECDNTIFSKNLEVLKKMQSNKQSNVNDSILAKN